MGETLLHSKIFLEIAVGKQVLLDLQKLLYLRL